MSTELPPKTARKRAPRRHFVATAEKALVDIASARLSASVPLVRGQWHPPQLAGFIEAPKIRGAKQKRV